MGKCFYFSKFHLVHPEPEPEDDEAAAGDGLDRGRLPRFFF